MHCHSISSPLLPADIISTAPGQMWDDCNADSVTGTADRLMPLFLPLSTPGHVSVSHNTALAAWSLLPGLSNGRVF